MHAAAESRTKSAVFRPYPPSKARRAAPSAITTVALVSLTAVLAVAACGPAEVAHGPAPDPAPVPSAVAGPAWVEPLLAALPERLTQARLAPAPGERPFEVAASAECVTLRERALLERVFAEGHGLPRLVGDAGLTPAGQHVADVLADAATEGLDPARYGPERFPPLIAAYDAARAAVQALPPTAPPTEDERRAIRAETERPGGAADEAALMRRLFSADGPVPRFARSFDVPERAALARARACWELALFDGLVTYLRDGRLGNPATAERLAIRALTESEPAEEAEGAVAEHGGGASERPGEATLPPFTVPAGVPLPPVLRDRAGYVSQQIVEALRAVRDAEGMDTLLGGAVPPHPQFKPLRAALARYRSIERAGGFSAVPNRGTIKPGATNDAVRALQARLVQEGFVTGEPTGTYDAATRTAIEHFQAARQLVVTGEPDAAFWKAIDVLVATRLQSLTIALGRVRRSRVDLDDTFVQVLIPDFHLEFWQAGKRAARHRVIVGKPRGTKCDEKTATMTHAYATPVQSAEIKRVVVAPYWNVTRTIKEQELDPQQAANPLYYQTNGYEVMRAGEPREWVRELPRPGNSLGFVKFLFPNPHDTYIHDTPTQPLFSRPVRAFSHGCMRVHEARDFARTVLSHTGQWNEGRFNALYDDWRSMASLLKPYDPDNYERAIEKAAELQTTLDLRTPIPVHVEYYTARVDESDRVHFLADIYGFDAQTLRPSPPKRCVPETRAARHGLDAVPAAVDRIEAEAQGLSACLARLPETRAALASLSPPAPGKLTAAAEALASFTVQHRAYADQVRAAQAEVVEGLAARGGQWRPALQERAVSVQRMLRGLRDMATQAKATCAKLDAATKR